MSARIGPPSSWNTPIVSPALEHLEGLRVVERDVVDVGPRCPLRRLDEIERELDDVEVAQPEEVHLEQAEVLDAVHLVLGDDRGVLDVAAGLRLALDRQVLGERLARDHDRGGVDAVLAPQALEAAGDVDHPLGVGIGRRRARAARPPSCSRPRGR